MILVPGKFIYLCTPTTGSRSTAKVLLEQCGGVLLSANHHATKTELNTKAPNYSEPLYSVLRNPYELLASKYWHRTYKRNLEKHPFSFADFLIEVSANARYDQFGPILATYQDYVNRYFLYEDGLESFFKMVGFPDVEIPKIGRVNAELNKTRINWRHLDYKYLQAIDKLFPRDVELYKRVTEQKHGYIH